MAQMQQENTLMTLDELNRFFCLKHPVENPVKPGTAGARGNAGPCIAAMRVISDVLFYLIMAIILYTALSAELNDGNAVSIMGFSGFTVMSSSMEDEIPKGSLIITRYTEPSELVPGDNITFTRNGSAVTHKIIGITELGGSGGRRFQTKGVNNASADDFAVESSDVLGAVVLVLPRAGDAVSYISGNLHILLIAFIACAAVSFLMRAVCGKAG